MATYRLLQLHVGSCSHFLAHTSTSVLFQPHPYSFSHLLAPEVTSLLLELNLFCFFRSSLLLALTMGQKKKKLLLAKRMPRKAIVKDCDSKKSKMATKAHEAIFHDLILQRHLNACSHILFLQTHHGSYTHSKAPVFIIGYLSAPAATCWLLQPFF